jgi:hypothetical protein
VLVEVLVEVVAVATCVGGLGGSRWNIPLGGWGPEPVSPTAKPSVGDFKYTECSPKPGFGVTPRGGASGVIVQELPSQCAKTAFDVPVSRPTAHPSPLPEPIPNVSMKTDVKLVVPGAPIT